MKMKPGSISILAENLFFFIAAILLLVSSAIPVDPPAFLSHVCEANLESKYIIFSDLDFTQTLS